MMHTVNSPAIFAFKNEIEWMAHHEKLNLTQIADFYGMSLYVLKTLLRSFNITIQPTVNTRQELIPAAEKETIENMYHVVCATQQDIAKHYGVSLSTLRTFFKKHGIAFKSIKWKNERDNLIRMYHVQLQSTTEIARHYGVHRTVVFQAMQRLGIEMRSTTWHFHQKGKTQ